MAANEVTPDKRLKSLLSSFISKSSSERSNSRKRCASDVIGQDLFEISVDASERKRRHVDPQDEEAFFERVESFNMATWFAKPGKVSPLICSQYGWKNVEKDILKCVGCQAVLCGQLPKNADSLMYKESCKKLIEGIKTAHQKSCFWPAYPSPDSHLRIPIKDKGKLLSLITEYICSLQRVQHLLPNVSVQVFSEYGLSPNHLEEMKSTAETTLEHLHLDNLDVGTFCLAVAGWKSIDEKTGMLACHFCRRKVGSWNYKKRNDSNLEESEESDSEIHNYPNATQNNVSVVDEKLPGSVSEKDNSSSEMYSEKLVNETINKNKLNDNERDISNVDNFHFALPKTLNFSEEIIDSEKGEKHEEVAVDTGGRKGLMHDDVNEEKIFTFSIPSIVDNNAINPQLVGNKECNIQKENGMHADNVDNTGGLSSTNSSAPSNSDDNQHENVTKCNSASQGIDHSEQSTNSGSVDQSDNTGDQIVNNEKTIHVNGGKDLCGNGTEHSTSNGRSAEVSESHAQPIAGRKKIKVVKKDSFNPLEEHRYWCPWINKLPDSVSYSPQKITSVEGMSIFSFPWEHVLQVLCPSFFEIQEEDSMSEQFKQHSPVAGLRHLRRLMKDWSN